MKSGNRSVGARAGISVGGLAAVVVCAVVCAVGCRGTPGDLREWRPTDHLGEDGGTMGPFVPPPADDTDPTLTARAMFATVCAACHGPEGRGDGPQANMARPPDFTSAAFQRSRTDAELRASIARGKGAMPAFGETIRPEGLDVLVQWVRHLGTAQP